MYKDTEKIKYNVDIEYPLGGPDKFVGHISKGDGQKVIINRHGTGSMKKCILSEYWPGQDLDKQVSVKGHNFKDKVQKVKMTALLHKSHFRLICPETLSSLIVTISDFLILIGTLIN